MFFRFFLPFLGFFLLVEEAVETSVVVPPSLFITVVGSEPSAGKASIAANEYTSNFFIALSLLPRIILIIRSWLGQIAAYEININNFI